MKKMIESEFFPKRNDPECTHSIGLYMSGRCRICGFKVMESVKHRAQKLGLRLVRSKDSVDVNSIER